MCPAPAEWTIMVFMNGDNNLEPFALRDFAEMARVGSTEKVNVVVQFDRSGRHAITAPQWTQALRFRVEKDMVPEPSTALADLGETNMGDGAVLGEFVSWARERFPAQRYMLDIWDHGQGWRFFETRSVRGTREELDQYVQFRRVSIRRETDRRSRSRLRSAPADGFRNGVVEIRSIPLLHTVASPVRYVSTDDTSGDHLFNREIQDTLAGSLGSARLDVIGFDACLMGMVETAYAMRDIADVMVASEELEPGPGWNYAHWLAELVANPAMNATDLAQLLVQSYRRTYELADGTTTLSAVNLRRVPDLVAALDPFAEHLRSRLVASAAAIREARLDCATYAPGYGLHGIDAGRFCERIGALGLDADLTNAARNVFTEIGRAVIANYAGDLRQAEFGSSGLAIYFPESRSLYNTDPDGDGYVRGNPTFPVAFVEDARWVDFLHAYFNRVA